MWARSVILRASIRYISSCHWNTWILSHVCAPWHQIGRAVDFKFWHHLFFRSPVDKSSGARSGDTRRSGQGFTHPPQVPEQPLSVLEPHHRTQRLFVNQVEVQTLGRIDIRTTLHCRAVGLPERSCTLWWWQWYRRYDGQNERQCCVCNCRCSRSMLQELESGWSELRATTVAYVDRRDQ
jgi:hypothetical protein